MRKILFLALAMFSSLCAEGVIPTLGVVDFDIRKTVCFTDRQKKILEKAVSADTKQQIEGLIQELLKGEFVV